MYNDANKPVLASWTTYIYPERIKATTYLQFKYNGDNLLTETVSYEIDEYGDTTRLPRTQEFFEYEHNRLSKVISSASSIVFDDFIWDGDNLLEYKYYYLDENNAIKENETRITQNTYLDDNVHTSLYKEIYGRTFHNERFQYDDKINPYYKSELMFLDASLLNYSSKNNWVKSFKLDDNSENMTKTYTYNSYNYPTEIVTDYNNGNIVTKRIKYKALSTIELEKGWNFISFNNEVAYKTIDSVFCEVMNSVEIIKTQDDCYVSSNQSHLNSLKHVEIGQGYLVKMSEPAVLNVDGSMINPSGQTTALHKGWNLIGIPYYEPINIAKGLSSISDTIEKVLSFDGFYKTDYELNSLETLEPNKGYFIHVGSDCVIHW